MHMDELIRIREDEPQSGSYAAAAGRVWNVLVVDDDPEVLSATRLALKGVEILGRRLVLLGASTAREAHELLNRLDDIAVILLDVVMESADSGLQLVQVIREELGLKDVRIILRTGEPGYAPEMSVISNFDINDYKTKSELTQIRLITALTTALRSYAYIHVIRERGRGLEEIVHASAPLLELQSFPEFARRVLGQMARVPQLPLKGVLFAQRPMPVQAGGADRGAETGRSTGGLLVLAAEEALTDFVACPLEQLSHGDHATPAFVTTIGEAMLQKKHVFTDVYTVLYLSNQSQEAAILLENSRPLAPEDRQLVEVFAANIAACFANVVLFEQLQHSACHDALTGLPVRSRFLLDIEADIEADQEGKGDPSDALQVALVGVSGLQEVNDGLGLDVGDQAILSLAQRLTQHFGATCRVARLGEDCFGVAGPASQVAPHRLEGVLEEPLIAGEYAITLGYHLGLCRADASHTSSDTLLKRASMALQTAFKSHRPESSAMFEPMMEENTRQRLEIIRQLREDFRLNRLQLVYQPQLDLRTGRLIGLEALLRWPSPTGYRHPPSVFIPLAESAGLIGEMGDWTLQQACQDFAVLQAFGFEGPPRVAVNVSQIQFRSSSFVNEVAETIQRCGLTPDQLELEVTETVAMDEPQVVIANFQKLRALGVRLAIDDFGMGYSSLTYLRHLPIHSLKIDRTFVDEIAGEAGVLAEAIIRLGQQLSLEVIAEGVETDEQEAFLRAHGCDLVQGYRYARPMTLKSLQAWMRARSEE